MGDRPADLVIQYCISECRRSAGKYNNDDKERTKRRIECEAAA
jgi:hypothetical protein